MKNLSKPWALQPVVAFAARQDGPVPADLVSVCVTVFNYERYLDDCLNSIAAQTHQNLDVVIVDDKSDKDDSLTAAVTWAAENAARFYRISVLSHPRNQGPAAARNSAFTHALGESVFIIDADNEIYPRCIARLYAALQDSGFDATYSQLEYYGDERKIGSADIWDAAVIAKENYVDVMALIKKAAWQQVDGFCHIEEGWEDYDFWLKFIDAGLEPGYVPEILSRYRVHGKSRTRTDAYAAHEQLRAIMAYRHPVEPMASQAVEPAASQIVEPAASQRAAPVVNDLTIKVAS
ncbi:MAG: glycosyl transferase [Acidocella sp. 20-57-95]|nr:MAG: glycosyl transferase [Acidocella sp. 20-57-95]HQT64222.1 glycosyltransferase family 2 protein [Acidocella sp.]HQU05267.1 glycosyltransferase family 2 protein [Acidocella sp.]